VLHMNEQTQQRAALMIVGTLCLSILLIVGVCVVRVALDGNAPLTAQITTALLDILPWLAGMSVTALLGKGVASAVLAHVTGAGASTGSGGA
jgi:hypothetical protein